MKKPLAYGPVLDTAIGKRSSKLETVVHSLTIFTMCGAVACSMGVGLMQIGAGVEYLTGLKTGAGVWLVVAVIITVLFTVS